jgi:hypothetical protein
MADAVDHDVVELHAMRAFEIVVGLRGLLQPFHANRGWREVVVAAGLDDVVAGRDLVAVQGRLHCRFLHA